jgi:hypothetical protein
MRKPTPEKKPATPEPTPTRILPMELKIRDRLVDGHGRVGSREESEPSECGKIAKALDVPLGNLD